MPGLLRTRRSATTQTWSSGRPTERFPGQTYSRLSDEEMKALMIDVVNKTYHALIVLFDDRLGGELIKILAQRDFLPRWNEPTLTTTS